MSGVAAHAQIDTALDKTVWKMAFGLTDAQVNDPQWLARDDDGDGMSNGGEFRAGTNPLQASSTLSVKAVSANERTVALTFPTVRGSCTRSKADRRCSRPRAGPLSCRRCRQLATAMCRASLRRG
jgi:hypothetical protein